MVPEATQLCSELFGARTAPGARGLETTKIRFQRMGVHEVISSTDEEARLEFHTHGSTPRKTTQKATQKATPVPWYLAETVDPNHRYRDLHRPCPHGRYHFAKQPKKLSRIQSRHISHKEERVKEKEKEKKEGVHHDEVRSRAKVPLYGALIGCELLSVIVMSIFSQNIYFGHLFKTIVWSELFTNALIVVFILSSLGRDLPELYEVVHHVNAVILFTICFCFVIETIFFSFGSFLISLLTLAEVFLSSLILSLFYSEEPEKLKLVEATLEVLKV